MDPWEKRKVITRLVLACSEHGHQAICSSMILVIHGNIINGTNHVFVGMVDETTIKTNIPSIKHSKNLDEALNGGKLSLSGGKFKGRKDKKRTPLMNQQYLERRCRCKR
jgi:hypothetical protein